MTTSQQIDSFTTFARALALAEGEQLTLDEVYDRWWQQQNQSEDLIAIKQAHAEYESGERGRPVEDFMAEFDSERAAGESK